MARMGVSISFIAVLISLLDQTHGFVAPVPVGRSNCRAIPAGPKVAGGIQARPQQSRVCDISRRQASMSANPGKMSPPGVSGDDAAPPASRSRLSRISGRVRKMIRKAIMGYIPEEEVSYKERAAQQAAAAAKLRGEPQIADDRLRDASMAAKAAALEATMQQPILSDDEDDEDDILNSDFVQLKIGDQSPMEAEDKLASLRRRLEQGLPADTAQEQAEKKRLAMQQQLKRQQQQQQMKNQRSSRPPSFDGDTAVAERPSPTSSGKHQSNEDATRREAPKEAPKLASAEDVERLNRMFGSMGGEPLR